MKYQFGKDITHTFYPSLDGEAINLPSQVPSIFLWHEDNKPSTVTAAQAGTSAIGSEIVYWTHSDINPYPRAFTIPKIDDPYPESTDTYQGYWLAINYIAQAGGTKHTVMQYFECERLRPVDGVPGAELRDLKEVYPAITAYLKDSELEAFLTIAEEEMRFEFEAKGFEWARVYDLKKTRLALAYKTIALCALSQIKEDGDKHHLRFSEFNRKYEQFLSSLTLPLDTDKDDVPDGDIRPAKTYAVISR